MRPIQARLAVMSEEDLSKAGLLLRGHTIARRGHFCGCHDKEVFVDLIVTRGAYRPGIVVYTKEGYPIQQDILYHLMRCSNTAAAYVIEVDELAMCNHKVTEIKLPKNIDEGE